MLLYRVAQQFAPQTTCKLLITDRNNKEFLTTLWNSIWFCTQWL